MDSSHTSPPSDPPSAESEAREERKRWVDPADLRGGAQLAVEAALETTRLVESVHAGVLNKFKLGARSAPKKTRGLTGWIYRMIRRIVQVSGNGTTAALHLAERAARRTKDVSSEPKARERLVSVLNGVLGDHLAATDNPLARPFSLRTADGTSAADADRAETLVVFVHGLCCSDQDWKGTEERPGHVPVLTDAVDGTAVFARYNSGLPIAQNGQQLVEHLDALFTDVGHSPRIVFVTHSMGGLVVRSAVRHAEASGARWPEHITETIYLGTPHQGAPLERAGIWVEEQLRKMLFTMPVADLGAIRSQGIKDLRHGESDPTDPRLDDSEPSAVVAPAFGRVLYVGSTIAGSSPIWHSVGDGLVPLDSALNASDPSPATRKVFENVGHLKLLRDAAVTDYLRAWLQGC